VRLNAIQGTAKALKEEGRVIRGPDDIGPEETKVGSRTAGARALLADLEEETAATGCDAVLPSPSGAVHRGQAPFGETL
jgi:hypothetical protein